MELKHASDRNNKSYLLVKDQTEEEQATVNFLNIRTPTKFVVMTLKFELCGSTIEE